MSTTRIIAVDPHAVVRVGLRTILGAEPGIVIVGEAADAPTAVRLIEELEPDVVVAEVALLGATGAGLTAQLCRARPHLKVLALTACEDGDSLRQTLAAGALGYALKRAEVNELIRAIRTVAGGGVYLDPAVAAHAVGVCVHSITESAGSELSERETEVVRLIARGYSNKQIAARLRVSVKTVETYKGRGMEKLGIRGRVELVRYAVGRGWLANLDEGSLVANERTVCHQSLFPTNSGDDSNP